MANKVGKAFEENIKKSVPDNVLYYRLRDSAQAFGQTSRLRFSAKNPCDCFIYDGKHLYTLELKTVGTKSISFERTKEDKGEIHYHQIQGLEKFAEYKNVISGLLLDFRLSDMTYFLSIHDYLYLISQIDKKSFNEKDMYDYCNPIVIKKKKLKVNYRYDIDDFIYQVEKLEKTKCIHMR